VRRNNQAERDIALRLPRAELLASQLMNGRVILKGLKLATLRDEGGVGECVAMLPPLIEALDDWIWNAGDLEPSFELDTDLWKP
jgi:hypothetical protein